METLRCPICLSMLPEAGASRCPACRSRLRSRKRPIVLGEDTRIADRPLLLVERELDARIEAETAAGRRERRRAAKVARRIAALPPTVFQNDVGAGTEAEADGWSPQPAPAATQFVVDLPAAAIHEVTTTGQAGDDPAEIVIDLTPEPVVEVAPVAPRRRRRLRVMKAARPDVDGREDVEIEPEAVAAEVPEAVPVEPVVEVVAVEPEPVVEVVAVEPEPVVEVAPVAPRRRRRLRVMKAARPDADGQDLEVGAEAVAATEVLEAAPVAGPVEAERDVSPVESDVAPVEIDVAPTEVLEAAPVAEPMEPAALVEPVVDLDEDSVIDVEPVSDPAPIATTSWKRTNSAWIDRVFSQEQRLGKNEPVAWPRPRAREVPRVDHAAESRADAVDETG